MLLLTAFLFLDTKSASGISQVVNSNGKMQQSAEKKDHVTRCPKSSVNLAALKAAFSSGHSSHHGNKSSVAKAANSGPTQKTLQMFFKDTVKSPPCNSSVRSPLKATRDLAEYSSVGKSVLDGFRYGKTSCSNADAKKDSAVTVPSPDIEVSGLEFRSSEPDTDCVKEEEEESDNTQTVPEPHASNEDCPVSPDAKRARKEKPHSPTKHESNTSLKSSSRVDAPVRLQKRTVNLQFSLQELAGKVKRIQDLQRQKDDDELLYGRFRAKINPGENNSAEEELKKEIRWDFTPIGLADCQY